MDYKFEQTKSGRMKVKEEFTPARRWSFLVGANEKSHTAQSRLVDILANDEQDPTLKEIEKAFDIETVTKEFFLKYRELFLHTKEELDRVVKKDPKIKADFESKGVDVVNFAKKLLGQIIFLYFLQKKGWFGVGRDDDWNTGSKHFLRELFEKKHGDYNNFFNDILEPLFYDALRNDRSHDDGYYSRFNCKIPFLNGGLFDPIGNYDWVHTDIFLPNKLFSNQTKTKEGDIGTGILDVFDRYNFTVKEDEPLEKEVAIDPELLGKSYEKFNAIRPDNFAEFKKALKSGKKGEENKFNKKFGVYYTPREIVHYMCQQSLINYLATEVIASEAKQSLTPSKEDIETLIHIGEQVSENEARVLSKGRETKTYFHQLPESIRKNAKQIDDKLAEITVCDPAVGSGAFPVGMMSEIVKARNVLTPFLSLRGAQATCLRAGTHRQTKQSQFDDKRTVYNFKRRCIEHSLYGVDIDPGAVEIAKLRLWLSLVVDEDDIKNIKPLPNLDYKVICGNSLLGVEKNLFNYKLFNELEKLKPLFFNETNPTKKQEYKKQIDKLISEITSGHKEFDFEVYFSEVFLSGAKSASGGDNKDGFDVVIANPPYVGEKGHKEIFREIKRGPLGEFHQGKMDLFYFFLHLSLNLANQNGHIVFITTNYYPTAYGGSKLRQDLKARSIVRKMVNFNELRIFESALGQHNMITILAKGHEAKVLAETCVTKNTGLTDTVVLQNIISWKDKNTDYYSVKQMDLYEGNENYIRLTGSAQSYDPTQRILERIKKQGENLDTICDVKVGARSGIDRISKKHLKIDSRYNLKEDVFVVSQEFYDKVPPNEKTLVKQLFKNSDIHRYCYETTTDQYLLYIGRKTNIDSFPYLKKHLSRFKPLIEKIRGLEHEPWYSLVRTREERIFKGPKIVIPQRSKRNDFAFNAQDFYSSSDVYYILNKKNDDSINLKYVISLLNSKLYYLWLYHKCKRKGETFELYQKPLSEIPVKKVSKEEQEPFIEIVNKILSLTQKEDCLRNTAKQAKVKELEKQIDQLVYKLYDLTREEIKIVEGGLIDNS
jgi:hypothetical protein